MGACLLGTVLGAAGGIARRDPQHVRPNRNTEPAGVLRDGALTVLLEATESRWHLNGPDRAPMTIEAFAEPGKAPVMPGPLVRAPAGTVLHLTIRNSLRAPLTFLVPAALRGGPDGITAMDSIVVAPGAAGTLTTRAAVPGTYLYRAMTPDPPGRHFGFAGLLGGAIVVDSSHATARPRDRVFVVMATEDSASVACDDTAKVVLAECAGRRFVYTINGESWPGTERIRATVGDSLHWRVLNASFLVHPMHLHGFYFRVDAYTGPLIGTFGLPAPGQMVVTQLMAPLSAMEVTWSPDRPGNWLFHCHFAMHNMPDSLTATADDPHQRGMIGLAIGTMVVAHPGMPVPSAPGPARRIRFIAETGTAALGARDGVPSGHFVIEEQGRSLDTHADWSPELDLVRDEPVAITIVNLLDEPTTVHWHGIEVEDSYVDGMPGFSGAGRHLAPTIEPGDSFVARFTPRRAGTFMYHAHVDEEREELAGLEGALIVRDPGAASSSDDHVFLLKGDVRSADHPLEVNGQSNPDTVVLHAGRAARLRLLNLATAVATAAPQFSLTALPDSVPVIARDTMLERWQLVAKDAFDAPPAAQGPRAAQQVVAVGETYDFEFTPGDRRILRLEVRTAGRAHRLLLRVPIRVE